MANSPDRSRQPHSRPQEPGVPPVLQPTERTRSTWDIVVAILTPFASLWLTVALFVLAIFIVFAGTLAQTEKDIWQVVHDYFRMDLHSVDQALRSAFAWIDIRIFFPRSFFPEMERIPWGYGFYFPSGWLIGFGLFLNLTAAHLIRFRMQAKGSTLLAGAAIVVLSIVLAFAVIAAGQQQTASQLQLFTDWPSLRITWLLVQCTTVACVLLAGCWLIFGKRAGIVTLHSGVGLMMFGELLVGIAAVEGQMHIVEGETVNYVMDSRKVELAVLDLSDPQKEDITVVPQSMLLANEVVTDANLPFDVEPLEFQLNSARSPASPADKNPATAGIGLKQLSVPAPSVSGTDMSGDSNRPAAYVRLLKKGTTEPLGVYLFGLEDWMRGRPEKIQVGRQDLRCLHALQAQLQALLDAPGRCATRRVHGDQYAQELFVALAAGRRVAKRRPDGQDLDEQSLAVWGRNFLPIRTSAATPQRDRSTPGCRS